MTDNIKIDWKDMNTNKLKLQLVTSAHLPKTKRENRQQKLPFLLIIIYIIIHCSEKGRNYPKNWMIQFG